MKSLFLGLIISFLSIPVLAQDWVHCYNEEQNRVYFQTQADLKRHQGACLGRTYFQGPKHHLLVEDSVDDKGFSKGEKGSSLHMNLDDGRSLLVSHWTHLGKYNTLMVLMPDFDNHRVEKLCTFDNYSDEVRAQFDGKKNQLKVLVRQPKTKAAQDFIRLWKPCSL